MPGHGIIDPAVEIPGDETFSRDSFLYDYTLAVLIRERREAGWGYRRIVDEFLESGIRSYRGRYLTPARLSQLRNTYKNATLDHVERALAGEEKD